MKWIHITIGMILFITFPIIINLLVSNDPWFNIKVTTSNDWIGFYGDYLGSLITVIALAITIIYTTNQYKDQDRKRIQPYITIKQLHKNRYKNEVAELTNEDYKMGLIAGLSEQKTNINDIFFNEVEFYGELMNIGIGTAINIKIKNISIEKRKFEYFTNYIHALEASGKFIFRIHFIDLVIKNELQNKEYKDSLKLINESTEEIRIYEIPSIVMNFNIIFDDMLGNTYEQIAVVKIQVVERNNVQEPNVLFQRVSYPVLKSK